MFTGIVAAVGEVRSCEAIGAGRDMRLVIGVPGGATGAPGVMRAGGLLFLPPVASGAGVGLGDGVRDCVRAVQGMVDAEGLGLGAVVRLGVAVVAPADMGAALPGGAEDEVRRALVAALPEGGAVPAVSFVSGLPGGAAVQVEAVARAEAARGAGGFLSGVALGASIACSGCCLTVVAFGADWFAVEASAETLSLTTLGGWAAGTRVNLERALRLGDELGGHMVSGHVDGLGEMVSRVAENGSVRMEFAIPGRLARFVATKGSIAVDGVSLTVNSVRGLEGDAGRGPGHGLGGDAGQAGAGVGAGGAVFGVNVILHTAQATTLGLRRPGEAVHIEVDGAARNAARLADPAWSDRRWTDLPGADLQGADRQAWDGSGDAARTGA